MEVSDHILRYHERLDATVPEIPLHQFLLDQWSTYGDRIACVHSITKEEYTYRQLRGSVRQFAAGLQSQLKIGKGQCVALALPNCVEFPIAVVAVCMTGATVSFVNPIYTPRELDHVAGIIQPDFWICFPEFVPSLQKLSQSNYSTRAIVIGHCDGCITWQSIMESGENEDVQPPEIDIFDDVATLPFSSGTTGLPKGVMLTHNNMVTAICQFKVWAPYTMEDVNLALLPFFHQYGCLIALTTYYMGARIVIVPRFKLEDMLQVIQDFRITKLPIVPPLANLLAKHPIVDQYDLSSVTGIISSAAPLSLDIMEELTRKYGWSILQGYGLTETTLATHFTLPHEKRPGSVGLLMPYFESKVIDLETRETLPIGQVGEVCVRGPMVMKGYRGDPGSTGAMIDSEGWLYSGDVGCYDKDGWLYIKDRMKELIKYKGMQVPPSELEHLLLNHPEISDAAVIGLPDEMAGELPRAYVVKRPGSTLTESQVADFIADQVAPFKKLRGGVVFIASIPKTPSGKILRRELKQMATQL